MTSILIIFVYSLFLPFLPAEAPTTSEVADKVTIEIINQDDLDFDFSIKHQELRNQIHVRTDKSIRSVRLMDDDKKKKAYNVIGSNLVILPMRDFTAGQSHFLEIKFISVPTVVLAKINVPEVIESEF